MYTGLRDRNGYDILTTDSVEVFYKPDQTEALFDSDELVGVGKIVKNPQGLTLEYRHIISGKRESLYLSGKALKKYEFEIV